MMLVNKLSLGYGEYRVLNMSAILGILSSMFFTWPRISERLAEPFKILDVTCCMSYPKSGNNFIKVGGDEFRLREGS